MLEVWRSLRFLLLVMFCLSALVGGLILLIRLSEQLEVWQAVAGWVVLVLVAGYVLRPLFELWIGPVLAFDAVRLARRPQLVYLRTIYVFTLLLVLFFVYIDWFGQDAVSGLAAIMDEQTIHSTQQAKFAGSFFYTFLIAQYVVVLILTPSLTGGAIVEDREKDTLPLMLVCGLSSRQIVLGKLLARVGHLVLLLLAGLPVLSILQLLGGIDPIVLVTGFVFTLFTIVSSAAFSIYCSVQARRVSSGVFLSYLSILGQLMLSSVCFGIYMATWGRGDLVTSFLWPMIIYGIVAFVFLMEAASRLRRNPLQDHLTADQHAPRRTRKSKRGRVPAERPIQWKDTQGGHGVVGGEVGRDLRNLILFISFWLAGFVPLLIVLIEPPSHYTMLYWVQGVVFLPIVVVVEVLRLGMRGAISISGERERETLTSLLTTDMTNEEILKEKWLGCLGKPVVWLIVFAVVLLVGLLVGSVTIWTLPLYLASVASLMAFALSLGMYCSLVARSTFQAMAYTTLGLLGMTLGHWIVATFTSAVGVLLGWSDTVREILLALHTYGLTPLINLPRLGREFDPSLLPLRAAWVGVLIYTLLALFFWWRTYARFGEVTGRVQ